MRNEKVISSLVKVAEADYRIGFVTGKVYYFNSPNILQTVGKFEHPIKWNGEHIGGGEKDIGKYGYLVAISFTGIIYYMFIKSG